MTGAVKAVSAGLLLVALSTPARADSRMVQSPLLERTFPQPDPLSRAFQPEASRPETAARRDGRRRRRSR